MDNQKIVIIGEIIEVLPDFKYRVRLTNNHEVLAYLSGKMKIRKIRVDTGDQVKVEFSPYDLTKGRIIYRI